MKRFIKIICLIMVIIMPLVTVAHAEEVSPYSSLFFIRYSTWMGINYNKSIVVYFDVVGKGIMDEVGVYSVEIQESEDNKNWTVIDTLTAEMYPYFICEDTGSHYDNVVFYYGSTGYYYRARVTFWGKNSSGTGTASMYTETEYIDW